jgi:hypothetical protein
MAFHFSDNRILKNIRLYIYYFIIVELKGQEGIAGDIPHVTQSLNTIQ